MTGIVALNKEYFQQEINFTNLKLEKSNNVFTACVNWFKSVCRSISAHRLCVFILGCQYVCWFQWAVQVTFLNVGNCSLTSTTTATCSSVDMTPVKLVNKYSHTMVFLLRSAWLCLWRRVMWGWAENTGQSKLLSVILYFNVHLITKP